MPTKRTSAREGRAAGKRTANKTARSDTRGRAAAWDKAFLAALRRNGVITTACEAAGVGRTTVYDKRNADPVFAIAWDEALVEAADRIEAEVIRRAIDGYGVPVRYKGDVVGIDRAFSDSLAQMVLKAHKPDKYKERVQIDIPEINKALPILQELLDFLRSNDQDFTEAQRQFLAMLKAQKEAANLA
jgi:hypothetical protein